MIAWFALAVAAPPGWSDVKESRITRFGPVLGADVGVADLRVETFVGGPHRAPDGDEVPAPWLPDDAGLDGRLADVALAALIDAAHRVRVDLGPTPAEGVPGVGVPSGFLELMWSDDRPEDVQAVLRAGQDRDSVVALRIYVGWCPTEDGAWAACVRSPEDRLGAGAPAVLGHIFQERRTTRRGGIRARRYTQVWTPYRYTAAPDGSWHDRPIVGVGGDFEAQAADAVTRAADLWMRAAVGRKALRRALPEAPTSRR